MSCDNSVTAFPQQEEQLAALSRVIIKRYKELVMEGPLSAYFTVVRGGMMDAAQTLTDQVEASIASFQDKILELVVESDYFKSANKSITEMQEAAAQFRALVDAFGEVSKPVDEAKAEPGTPE